MSETRPILIVGAGPTGLTAALELSRFGVPVRLVDKRPAPSTTSRALAVQARTLELFDQRGLTGEMLRLGNRAHATVFHADGKPLGKIRLDEIPSRHHYILLLSQAETERLLREQLARQGVSIERSTELVAFAQLEPDAHAKHPGGVRAVLRRADGSLEELDAAYLVCAEGAHSLVRHTAGMEFEGKSLSETYDLADLHIDGELPEDEISIFTAGHGLLAAFPLGGRRFRLIAVDPDKHGRGAADPTLEEMQKVYDDTASAPGRLRDVVWTSRFWINSRMLRTLRSGRVFFGGDSAHVHSPAGGQGMNTGIQDMINLGWKLALVWRGQAAPALLDTYEQDRLPVIRDVVKRTEGATDTVNSSNPLLRGIVAHVAPLLLGTSFVQQTGTGIIGETAANYRPSPLSETAHAPGKLHAGDRLPDLDVLAWNAAAARSATSLYGCLDPSRCTLLSVGDLPPGAAAWPPFVQTRRVAAPADPEAAAAFTHAFGTGRGFWLVRPDAYLGFVGGPDDLPALFQWLGRWFPAA